MTTLVILVVCMCVLTTTAATSTQPAAIPVIVSDQWTLQVGPGRIVQPEGYIEIPQAVTLSISPPGIIRIRGELHTGLAVYNDKAPGWLAGNKLKALTTEECAAPGLLVADSVRVLSADDSGMVFSPGEDYHVGTWWGVIGRAADGAITGQTPVMIDYDYYPCRLDSVVTDVHGNVTIVCGDPGVGVIYPPEINKLHVRVANIYLAGRLECLTDEDVYPVLLHPSRRSLERLATPQAITLLPRTLDKLRQGKDVLIVCWGDSVTAMGQYQRYFANGLKQRFPSANIEILTAGWGGASSRMWLEAPRGGTYDFVRDCLEPKPDLVTIEFVNDAGMMEQQTIEHYEKIVERFRSNGSEVILITPHPIRPDWMGIKSMKFDEDPRPYVHALRKLAVTKQVALADGSRHWTSLWREGIPYITLLVNSINHPDDRGHKLYAKALLELFPDR